VGGGNLKKPDEAGRLKALGGENFLKLWVTTPIKKERGDAPSEGEDSQGS
jgi:hypothetical protein